jgi:hypothetical protein
LKISEGMFHEILPADLSAGYLSLLILGSQISSERQRHQENTKL